MSVVGTEDRGEVRVIALRRPPVNAIHLGVADAVHAAVIAARDDAS